MKHKFSSLLILILFCFARNKAQSQKIIDLNKTHNSKWHCYFGVEGGFNHITTFSFGEKSNYKQYGALAEFYLSRNVVLCARIKYFDTGVSFSQKATSGWFGQDAHKGIFRGRVISIPINLKIERQIFPHIQGYFKFGWARNREIKSEYDFTTNLRTDYSKLYTNFNMGMGFSYFINANVAVYIDLENYYFGGAKGQSGGLIFVRNYYPGNNHLSLGAKFSLGLRK